MARLRHVAPAGAPISVATLLPWLSAWVTRRDHCAALEMEIKAVVGARTCAVFSTGRAALTVLLRSLRTLADDSRDEVIIPSYTCYSVAAAVVKAGLTPRLADIVPDTLDFDYERLHSTDFRQVLGIVATNLYGLPNDMPRLRTLARDRGVFVVDDAAQALGALLGGRPCGTLGDGGLYSFDKGKNVSAIAGGAIVTDDPRIARALSAHVAALPNTSGGDVVLGLIKLAAYSALLRPHLYWIPNSLPLLGLGQTVYTTDYAIARPPSGLAALARIALGRLDEFTATRRTNAEAMLGRLRGVAGLHTISPSPTASPAYLRLPVLLDDRETRDAAARALNRAGIGATGSYPTSIADIPWLGRHLRGDVRDARGGRSVASRILTLPTHPYVTTEDKNLATDVLLNALAVRRKISARSDVAVEAAAS